MAPAVEEGDFILFKVTPSVCRYKVGVVVVLKRLCEPLMIKRIVACNGDGSYQLAGDNIDSIPKTDIAKVQKQQILGQVVLKLGRKGMEVLS